MAPNLAWFEITPEQTDILLALMVMGIQLVQGLTTETSAVNDDVIAPTSIIHWMLILGSPLVIVFRRSYPMTVLRGWHHHDHVRLVLGPASHNYHRDDRSVQRGDLWTEGHWTPGGHC